MPLQKNLCFVVYFWVVFSGILNILQYRNYFWLLVKYYSSAYSNLLAPLSPVNTDQTRTYFVLYNRICIFCTLRGSKQNRVSTRRTTWFDFQLPPHHITRTDLLPNFLLLLRFCLLIHSRLPECSLQPEEKRFTGHHLVVETTV